MNYVITPPPIVSLPVKGEGSAEDGGPTAFAVRRIYCVGRNYAAHAVEMGHDPDKEPPFFFQKNPDNLVLDGRFPYPPKSEDVHHEIEMVVALGEGGRGHSARSRARPYLRLRPRPRHDPPGFAGRDEEARPPLGDRQGVRSLLSLHPAGQVRRHRSPRSRARSGWTSTANAVRKATSTR